MPDNPTLRIGWDEREFYHQHGLYLDKEKIGFITINREEGAIILFNIVIKEEHQHNDYYSKFLEQIEERGKNEGACYMIVQWVKPLEKIPSLEKRGFRRLEPDEHWKFNIKPRSNDGEEVSVIKEI